MPGANLSQAIQFPRRYFRILPKLLVFMWNFIRSTITLIVQTSVAGSKSIIFHWHIIRYILRGSLNNFALPNSLSGSIWFPNTVKLK